MLIHPYLSAQLFFRFWNPLLSIQKHLQASINHLITLSLSLEPLVATTHTSRPRAIDLSSDPLTSPPGSSPPDIDLLDPGETPNKASSLTLPTPQARAITAFSLDGYSSDPLTNNPFFQAMERSAATHRLSRTQNRKRGPSSLAPKLAPIDKTPWFDFT